MSNTFRVDSRYTHLKAIGRGSFGVVCSAFDEKQVRPYVRPPRSVFCDLSTAESHMFEDALSVTLFPDQ